MLPPFLDASVRVVWPHLWQSLTYPEVRLARSLVCSEDTTVTIAIGTKVGPAACLQRTLERAVALKNDGLSAVEVLRRGLGKAVAFDVDAALLEAERAVRPQSRLVGRGAVQTGEVRGRGVSTEERAYTRPLVVFRNEQGGDVGGAAGQDLAEHAADDVGRIS